MDNKQRKNLLLEAAGVCSAYEVLACNMKS